jgi:alpha-1,2-mannosyltransferase
MRVWKEALPQLPEGSKFILIGTVRDAEDELIVENLKKLAAELGIEKSVEYKIGLNREQLLETFAKAKVAIHTMKYEHFGIAIVELMAAGIVTIAHDSGRIVFLN